ncbi:MAG: ImmA/IrrE family metallo-endopeptidase [Henriciella sp.]
MANLQISGSDVRTLWIDRGLTDDQIADKTGIDKNRLDEILATDSAGVTEIQKLADVMRLTLTDVLVGTSPPSRTLTDFRTEGSGFPTNTPELAQTIEIMNSRLDFLLDEDLYLGAIVPKELSDAVARGPEIAASKLREILGIDEAPNRLTKFILWKTRIEMMGVMCATLPLGGAARGLAIYEAPNAAIVIASEEKTDGAKLFSLLHEFAHICRRESAISDQSWSKQTERWCNQFAAFALMPRESFAPMAQRAHDSGLLERDFWTVLRDLSDSFGASMMAVAYHLDSLGIGNGNSGIRYSSRYSFSEFLSDDDEATGGGSDTHLYTRINDFGLVYIKSIETGLNSETIDRYEVADALGIKYKFIDPLFEKVRDRSNNYAAK